jgi:hypothetical protein
MANTQTAVPLFVANAILTAAQQNISAGTGVPVFATTVTRDAAFGGSNKALAEGQLAYIEASNVVQYYDGAAWATVGPIQVSTATVATSQTTTSTTFTDLATAGPAVTVTTGTSALVIMTAQLLSTSGNDALESFAVSGATTTAAADSSALGVISGTGFVGVQASWFQVATLTAGSNTFTMKYRVKTSGTTTAAYRTITVIPL